jgi:CRP/FNR family transcriptional regulator, nitrogen oxide reductase regulator
LIERFALFAKVPRDDGEDILSAAREKRFACQEILFSDGDPVREVIMLLAGCVKVRQSGLNGNEGILWLHRDGEIVAKKVGAGIGLPARQIQQ